MKIALIDVDSHATKRKSVSPTPSDENPYLCTALKNPFATPSQPCDAPKKALDRAKQTCDAP